MTSGFPTLTDSHARENGEVLAPRFDANGLVTAVATDADTGDVLMVAHMNAEALARTIETGNTWYWSRSRGELWEKGATSGEIQAVVEVRVDCDQDAVWIKVRPQGKGAACHTGRRSCFYRRVDGKDGAFRLVFDKDAPLFDPKEVYRR
jgi:phosphoribosyl-AMP cyclohydrolase